MSYSDNTVSGTIGWILKRFFRSSVIIQITIGVMIGASIGVGLRYFPNALDPIFSAIDDSRQAHGIKSTYSNKNIKDIDRLYLEIKDFSKSSSLFPTLITFLTIPAILMVVKKIGYSMNFRKLSLKNPGKTIDADMINQETSFIAIKVFSTIVITCISILGGICNKINGF